jgi:mannosyltransferase OCH1-like enzyme
MNIEKADYYRLYALYEYGGIYSDFDNVIDYECIISLVGNSTKIVVSDQPCLDC